MKLTQISLQGAGTTELSWLSWLAKLTTTVLGFARAKEVTGLRKLVTWLADALGPRMGRIRSNGGTLVPYNEGHILWGYSLKN